MPLAVKEADVPAALPGQSSTWSEVHSAINRKSTMSEEPPCRDQQIISDNEDSQATRFYETLGSKKYSRTLQYYDPVRFPN